MRPIQTPAANNNNTKYERKLYTGVANFYLLPYANANASQLKEMDFYVKDDIDPSYNWPKGDRLQAYVECRDSIVYNLAGEEVDKLTNRQKIDFFVSQDKTWPKEKEDGMYTFILFNDGSIRWTKVKADGKGKDKVYTIADTKILNEPKLDTTEGTYRLFTNFTQQRLFEFFYIAIGWHSYNIGIKSDNNKIIEENGRIALNNKRKNSTHKDLLELKPFGQTYMEDGVEQFQSTDPTQIFDVLFPLDLEKVRDLISDISEGNGGICATFGINHYEGKAYQTLFSSISNSYTSIGNVPTPTYETKYCKTVKESIAGYQPKNAFFNVENMFLMEWTGDSNEDVITKVNSSDSPTDGLDLDDTLLNSSSIDDLLG